MKKLSKKTKNYWIVVGILWFLVLEGFNIGFMVGFNEIFTYVIGGVMALLIAFLGLIYPILKYKAYSYTYDEEKITINYGVIFKHIQVIPAIQIQDLHLVEGPVSMAFGLAKIVISTAGSNFVLAPIEKDMAKNLLDEFERNLMTRVKLSMEKQ